MATETYIYGEWPSPIGGADVARQQVGLAFPTIDAAGVWWQESRPGEGGRAAIVCQGPDGTSRDMLPMPWNARTRVHEYGGKSYQPLPDGFIFANFGDQRLYRCGATADPEPLTPAPGSDAAYRFADFVLSPAGDEVWCVGERHSASQGGAAQGGAGPGGAGPGGAHRGGAGRIARAIVAVPLDGSAADDPAAIRVLVSGSDFYAYPVPSPDGTRLAWICWDHPRMPWDGTELRVAALDDGGPVRDKSQQQLIMGCDTESVVAPVWRDDRSLYVISDRSGWWNLYLADLLGFPRALCPREEEFAGPLWQLGTNPYAVLADGRIAVAYGTGETRLGVLDPEAGRLTELDLPYQVFLGLSAAGQAVATIAGGPVVPMTVIGVDIPVTGDNPQALAPTPVPVPAPAPTPVPAPTLAATGIAARELSHGADSLPDPAYLPVPRAARLTGPSGSVVHALIYPPANPVARGPEGELPPYIVWVHGGPTAQAVPRLDLEKAFFTSRGIGIIDVNYGGSSGYGRAYRERLCGQWGVVDVADVMTAALALAEAGEADGKRLGIRGGSAGGWTALAAVTSGVGIARVVRDAEETGMVRQTPGLEGASGPEARGVFAAVASYFGVSDLRGFAAQTHDFESRYLDGLIGPLPEYDALYTDRAPVGHVNDATCPVLLLQGLDDPVVPPAQAESIAADLAAHSIPYAYITFEGESHGFRKAENIVASLEAELSFYGQIMGFIPPGVPPVPLVGG
jgi:dipeptidyl aminopeptidase/acylaminoacyl peptidase